MLIFKEKEERNVLRSVFRIKKCFVPWYLKTNKVIQCYFYIWCYWKIITSHFQ